MRTTQLRTSLLCAGLLGVLLAGCGGRSAPGGTPHDGGGGGSDLFRVDGGAACHGLSPAQCQLNSAVCVLVGCPDCNGNLTSGSCYSKDEPVPDIACDPGPCPGNPCLGLGEQACRQNPSCQVEECPDCQGGTFFTGCAAVGSGTFACPASCPAPRCQGLDLPSCIAAESRLGCRAATCSGCGGGASQYAGCYGPNDAIPACPPSSCPSSCDSLDEQSCQLSPNCQTNYCANCQQRVFVGCSLPGGGVECPPPPPCPMQKCDQIFDQFTCNSTPGCVADTCCGNFTQCRGFNDPPSVCAADCISCAGLDEQTCWNISSCRADYCPTCGGGDAFQGCSDQGVPPQPCPAFGCPSFDCSNFDEGSCRMNPNCHATYKDAGACGCAPAGCCTVFAGCGNGPADCSGPAFCSARGVTSPVCEGEFVNSFRDGCYEACVRSADCPIF